MKMHKLMRLGLFTGAMLPLFGGCSFDNLTRNIWVGFGQSIGAIPGATLGTLLSDLLFDLIPDIGII